VLEKGPLKNSWALLQNSPVSFVTGWGRLCPDMAFYFASNAFGGGPSRAMISARCDFASYWPFLSCICWNSSRILSLRLSGNFLVIYVGLCFWPRRLRFLIIRIKQFSSLLFVNFIYLMFIVPHILELYTCNHWDCLQLKRARSNPNFLAHWPRPAQFSSVIVVIVSQG
jgi:hypothetical protein